MSGKFPDIIFFCFQFVGIHLTLISFLFYVSAMGRRMGEGAQAQTGGKGGQAGHSFIQDIRPSPTVFNIVVDVIV